MEQCDAFRALQTVMNEWQAIQKLRYYYFSKLTAPRHGCPAGAKLR
jgi:hypothetical protein